MERKHLNLDVDELIDSTDARKTQQSSSAG